MTSNEMPSRQHVRQSLRMSAALVVVVVFGTILNWPEDGLTSIRAALHQRSPVVARCDAPVPVAINDRSACTPVAESLASR